MPGFETTATIISDVAKELALRTSAIADPFTETDQNIVQLVALLKPTGRMLLKAHPWQHLMREGSITTDGSDNYDLPSFVTDFGRLTDDTTWHYEASEKFAVVTPQRWQAAHQATGGVSATNTMRIMGDRFRFDPEPATGQTVRFEYISRNWGAASFAKETPTDKADVIQFDPHLFSRALILRFKTAKGFDTSAALDDYNEALAMAKGQDGAAPVLSLGGSRQAPWPNVPETGFGQ